MITTKSEIIFYWCDNDFNKLRCKICSSEILTKRSVDDKKHEISNLLEHVRIHIEAKRHNQTVIPSESLSPQNGSLNESNIMDNNNYPKTNNNISPNSINSSSSSPPIEDKPSSRSSGLMVDSPTRDRQNINVLNDRIITAHQRSINGTNPTTITNTTTTNTTTTNQNKTSRHSNQLGGRPRKSHNEFTRSTSSQANHSSTIKQNSNTLPYSRSSLTTNGSSNNIFQQTKANSHDFNSTIYNNLLGDPDRLTLTSTKSMPSSSSITKNLISRLNELSEPVKRKLKFWNKKSFQINQYDPSFKVIYLGNLGMQICSKDESCLDKPIKTLWNNYVVNMKTEIVMRLTICNSGLKAITRQHGLTQYWSNRLVYCCCHKNHPRIFAWIYRHEGKKMRQELRCHAVFCPSAEKASKMVTMLNQRLIIALQEFKREKKSNGQLVASTNDNTTLHRLPRTIPLRRQILAKGSKNFRPPLDRSKSAPKLTSIQEEDAVEDDEDSQDELEFEEYFDNKEDDDDDDLDSDDYEIDPSEWFGDNVPSDQSDRPLEVRSDDGRRIITNRNINNKSFDDYSDGNISDELSRNHDDDMLDKNNDDSIDSRPNPDDSPRGGSRLSANTPNNKSISSFQNNYEHHTESERKHQNEVREEELEYQMRTSYLKGEENLSSTSSCKHDNNNDDDDDNDKSDSQLEQAIARIRTNSVGNNINSTSATSSDLSNLNNEPTTNIPHAAIPNTSNRPQQQIKSSVETTSTSATDENNTHIPEDMYLSWRNDLVIR